MKRKHLLASVITVMGIQLIAPAMIQAESLDTLNQQEEQVTKQSQEISTEVQAALTEVNDAYQQVINLQTQIADNQEKLATLTTDIQKTQETVGKRKAVVAERLKSIQINQASESKLEMLLNAKSIQDFVNGVYAITVMQQSEKATIDSLNEATQKLEDLKEEAQTTQTTLEANQAELTDKAQTLDTKVAALQTELADKQDQLAQIASSKLVEESRLKAEAERAAKEKAERAAKEKAEQEAQAKAQAEEAQKEQAAKESAAQKASEKAAQATAETSKEETKTVATETKPTETPKVETSTPAETPATETPATNGKVVYVQATAYSRAEPGSSNFTFNGIDLRQNPQVIAVDPSVIPIGSIVNVEGYGTAIAADTGGAIKGNIIDVHFPTVEQCRIWGRKFNVKVTILN
ncbi:3D domain-containing protein [Enterococcus sp. AZ102]|uniref:3D domain-containing protein n=1 Tax=Enterococcus sp. AZ102 TaxID=2774865 RepID=UPI003F23071D